MTVWFGYHMPTFSFPGVGSDGLFDQAATLAKAAEDARFSLVTVMDHFYQIPGVGPETEPMLEAYSALAGLSQRTSRVRLGALVSGVTYRNPALLAKTVTTLDVLSEGRAVMGIGAAWNETEHEGYGFDFPRVGERMDRLDEALTIIRAMFREDRPSFDGEHYQIREALNVPRPVQAGGPRIIVGGGGEQRTLRIAAKHADMTHWFPLGFDVLKRKNELIERYCADIGRDPGTIERTMATPAIVASTDKEASAMIERLAPDRRPHVKGGTPEQAAEALRPYIEAGFTGFTFNNNVYTTPESIGAVGELLRLVA